MDETWMGLAIGVSTLAVALPMALAHYWREKDRARTLRNLGQEYMVSPDDSPGVVSGTGQHETARRALAGLKTSFEIAAGWPYGRLLRIEHPTSRTTACRAQRASRPNHYGRVTSRP